VIGEEFTSLGLRRSLKIFCCVEAELYI